MPAQEINYVRPPLELSLAGYVVNGASIGRGRGGATFAFTIGPISDAIAAALDGAAQSYGRICVLFPQPLLLDLVMLERKELHRIRIVGHIVGSTYDNGEAENTARRLGVAIRTVVI